MPLKPIAKISDVSNSDADTIKSSVRTALIDICVEGFRIFALMNDSYGAPNGRRPHAVTSDTVTTTATAGMTRSRFHT